MLQKFLHSVCLNKIRYSNINFIVLTGKFILAVVAHVVDVDENSTG